MGYKSSENANSLIERRNRERRLKKRRSDNKNSIYNGDNKRNAIQDRRLTIYNRQNIEVTDRRTEN